MAYNTKTSVRKATARTAFVKKRISKARSKAKFTGFLYLLATIALTALTCLSLVSLTVNVESGTYQVGLGVLTFINEFDALKAGEKSADWIVLFAIYGVLLLVLLINVIRSFSKLGWLFKKKASRLYGVNRNAYAMDDLGKIFSCSFTAVIIFHFAYIIIPTVEMQFELFAFVALGLGALVHFLCGMLGGKVSLFSSQNNLFVEEKREIGLFLPFVRNLFQIAAVGAILYFIAGSAMYENAYTAFMRVGNANIGKATKGVMWQEMLVIVWAAIIPALCAIILLITASMLKRALSPIEFDMEEFEAPGKNKFVVCSVFMIVFVVATYVVQMVVQPEAAFSEEFLKVFYIIAGISFAMLIVEIILRPREKKEKVETVDPDEIDSLAFAEQHVGLPVAQPEVPMSAEGKRRLEKYRQSYASDMYFSNFQLPDRGAKKEAKAQKKAEARQNKRRDEVTTKGYIYSKYKAAGARVTEAIEAVEAFERKKNPKKAKKRRK